MAKTYFHRDQVGLGVALAVGAAFLLPPAYRANGRLSGYVAAVLGAGGLGGLLLVVAWRRRYEPELTKATARASVRVEENCLRRFRRYPFRASSIGARLVIEVADITEVRLGWRPQVVIHGQEIIFLQAEQQAEMQVFAQRHRLPVANRPDVWALLAEPYLDNELTPEANEQLFDQLEAQGISRAEALAARQKIKRSLLLASYFSLEWIGYDHYDVLQLASPLWGRQRFYWYTMELALRRAGACE